ncbi:MAG: hypothetical protein JNK82_38415 [Myxococcaceae bacterium]|nr:hypothetical protein [Myxococcaceae bacterium]
MAGSEDPDEIIRLRMHLGEYAERELPLLALRPPNRITAGDREVIALLLAGKTDAQIAKIRETSLVSARSRITVLCRKLNVASRAALVQLLAAASK